MQRSSQLSYESCLNYYINQRKFKRMGVVRRIFKLIYELVEAFVVAASIFVVVYLFLMQPHQVKGSSMYPTLADQEYLLTDKVTFRRRDPQAGDIVVFKAPQNETFDFIKRVIAVPGDTIVVQNNKVYVNGEELSEDYLPEGVVTQAGKFLTEGQSLLVPEGSLIAFGDNRDHSSDSREWGLVPYDNIVGKAFFRYWPADKVGSVVSK